MKVRISATGDGTISGVFECTEEQYKWLEKVFECIGNEMDESYSPSVCLDIVEENK